MRLWHSLSLEELYAYLAADEGGLRSEEAGKRLGRFGYNELKISGEQFWKKIIEPFRSLFVSVLLIAAAISFLTHETTDGVIIAGIIAINSVIYYSQQYSTTRVMRTLKKQSQQYVRVLRDGQTV